MGMFDLPKFKSVKINNIKVDKIHITRAGDRTLTPAQRRKLKKMLVLNVKGVARNLTLDF